MFNKQCFLVYTGVMKFRPMKFHFNEIEYKSNSSNVPR